MPDHDISFGYQPGQEIGYTQITAASTNVTDTSEGTATALLTAGPFAFDGGPVVCIFSAAGIQPPQAVASFIVINLFEGATQIARLGIWQGSLSGNSEAYGAFVQYRFTPSAGLHTYKLTGFVSSTAGTPQIYGGNGGTGGYAPFFVRFTKV